MFTKMMLNRVKDHADLLKDRKSGAILLNDKALANDYLAKKQVFQNDATISNEINTIKEKLQDLEGLKSDIDQIKSLLQQIANNGTK